MGEYLRVTGDAFLVEVGGAREAGIGQRCRKVCQNLVRPHSSSPLLQVVLPSNCVVRGRGRNQPWKS